MAFLGQPFKHDMFVSFDHGRDQRLHDWTMRLIAELKDEILDFESDMNDFSIHVSTRERTHDQPLTAQFIHLPGSSGVVLVFVSKRFLSSDWCGEEAHWFEQELKNNLDRGGRPIMLLCEPTEPHEWPQHLQDIKDRLSFYSEDEKRGVSGETKPFGFPLPLPDDRAYLQALSKLSTVVVDHLRKIKSKTNLLAETVPGHVALPKQKTPNIYLHANPAHVRAWHQKKEELEDTGCRVYPEILQPVNNDLRSIEMAREERLRILKEEANGECALRVDSPIEQDIQLLASDRTALRVIGKNMPCAVIDTVGGDTSLAEQLGIQTVEAVNSNWTSSFQRWLDFAVYTER